MDITAAPNTTAKTYDATNAVCTGDGTFLGFDYPARATTTGVIKLDRGQLWFSFPWENSPFDSGPLTATRQEGPFLPFSESE